MGDKAENVCVSGVVNQLVAHTRVSVRCLRLNGLDGTNTEAHQVLVEFV